MCNAVCVNHRCDVRLEMQNFNPMCDVQLEVQNAVLREQNAKCNVQLELLRGRLAQLSTMHSDHDSQVPYQLLSLASRLAGILPDPVTGILLAGTLPVPVTGIRLAVTLPVPVTGIMTRRYITSSCYWHQDSQVPYQFLSQAYDSQVPYQFLPLASRLAGTLPVPVTGIRTRRYPTSFCHWHHDSQVPFLFLSLASRLAGTLPVPATGITTRRYLISSYQGHPINTEWH